MIRKTIFALALAISTPAMTEENRVTFPEIEALEQYTTVTRGEVTEFIYTTPEALAAIRAGQPVPNNTQFVLQDWRNGEVYRLFVMQKGEGFGAEYDEATRAGDWQFQWFWPDRSVNLDENTERCRACHQSRSENEFLYTYNAARTGQ